ncbi:hypothetical protein [Streptomyces sp. NPDC059071]|uniref:hypothetical protein n=1 Tax=unclassified Streptomyces TaxID=2593676 RepID=UPI00364D2E09
MIRRLARTGAVLATASLLLTACSGTSDDTKPKTAPSRHPVFDQKLDRQMFLAVRETQKAGSASFTQTLTLETKKGKAVQTLEGRLDFAKNTGDANIRWKVPKKFSDAAKDAILGRAPGRANADAAGRFLVDGRNITYRAGSSDYWLRYGYGDYDNSQKTLDQLRGTEAPVGGTLLEGLGGAEAKSRQGTNYQAEVDSEPLWEMLPGEISEQLTSEMYTPGVARTKKVSLTVSLDRQGRVTRVRADLSRMLGKKGSLFSDATSLTMELVLHEHGRSKPAGGTDGGKVLDAAGTVRSIHDVKAGHCIDFSTGQRDVELVVDVPCAKPHDGRVFAQATYGGHAYPGRSAAKSQASRACNRSYGRVSDDWTADSADENSYWYMWSGEYDWQQDGKGRTTCYVVTAKGAA